MTTAFPAASPTSDAGDSAPCAPTACDGHVLRLGGETLVARPSGALWRAATGLLTVSDLHLGKSERIARRGGALLPPYETQETLDRLAAEIEALSPRHVLCLGDSFDDLAAGLDLPREARARIAALAAGRRWTWIAGNHDPAPLDLPGEHLGEWRSAALVFRHEAEPDPAEGLEISGHFHPKARLAGVSRPCFVASRRRLILPAFGRYTGGLDVGAPALRALAAEGLAVLTGPRALAAPLSRLRRR